jgi:hypothetical protein
MNYLLSQLVWREVNGRDAWTAPDASDRILDLRPLSAQAQAVTPSGFILIATHRTPRPSETLLATSTGKLEANATDAVKSLLGIPETVTAQTMQDLVRVLLGVYSDPDAGLICPPLMPDRRGILRFSLGEIQHSEPCPRSGVVFDNVLKVLHNTYRQTRESGGQVHRKLLSVWKRKFGIANYEVFIPLDLPKESPIRPSTTLRDNFDVGNHTDIDGEASSDGWLWASIEDTGLAQFRTDGTTYAQCQASNAMRTYRSESDLSSTDHYVQAELRTENNAMTPIIFARKDSSADLTFYECQLGAGSDVLWILKVISGTPTVLTTNALVINTGTFYTIKFNIDGSTLQTFNSGSQVGTDFTDTAVTAGLRTGIKAQGSGGVLQSGGIENFEASDGLLDTPHVYRGRASRQYMSRRMG